MVASKLDPENTPGWIPEKTQVWTIGMIAFYLFSGEHGQPVADEVKQYALGIFPESAQWKDYDPIWYWVEMLLAASKGNLNPREVLPGGLFEGLYKPAGEWLTKVLCKEDDRYTLQEAYNTMPF